MQKLYDLLIKLIREKFYGEIHISFQAGKITKVKKDETLEPTQFA